VRRTLGGLALGLLFAACGGEPGSVAPFASGGTYEDFSWQPRSVALADFDGDRRLDLVASDERDGTVHVLAGGRGGAFAPPPACVLLAPLTAGVVLAGALDADGFPDLVVAELATGEVAVYLGDGAGGFLPAGPPVPALPPGVLRLRAGDLDADGTTDLVALAPEGDVVVLLGRGDGSLSVRPPPHPLPGTADAAAPLALRPDVHLALGAFDASPGVDLLLLSPGAGLLAVRSGNGDGSFGPPRARAVELRPAVIDVVALPRGGDADDLALLCVAQGRVAVGVLDLAGGSAPPLVPAGEDAAGATSLAVGDLDGDRAADLVLACPREGRLLVLRAARAPWR
jgi:hypothetical protein